MNQSLAEAVAWAAGSGRIGTILDLGAGNGELLQAPAAADASRIVLVEPNPVLLTGLAGLAKDDDRISILPVAIVENSGPATLLQFNFPAVASIQPASRALLELFPGLRQTQTCDIEGLSLADIIEKAVPPVEEGRPARDILIVEANGAEMRILRDLLSSDQTDRFSHIFLRAGRDALYEQGASLGDLQLLLTEAGYKPFGQDDSDADFPWLYLALDPLVAQLRHLRAEADVRSVAWEADRVRLREFATQVEALHQARDADRERIEELTKAHDGLLQDKATVEWSLGERDAQLAAAHEATRQHIEALSAQLDTALAESRDRAEQAEALQKANALLMEGKATAEAGLGARDQQLATLLADAEEQAKAREADRQRIAQLGAQVDTVTAESRGRSQRVEELKKANADLLEGKAAGEAAIADRDGLLTTLRSDLEEQVKAREADRERIKHLGAQIDAVTAESRSRGLRVEELEKASKSLLEGKAAAEAATAERDQQIAALRVKAEAQGRAREADRLRIEALGAQLDTVAAENRGRSHRVEDLKKANAALLEGKTAVENALVERDHQMTLLQGEADELRQAHMSLLEEKAALEGGLAERDQQLAALRSETEQQRDARQADQQRIKQLVAQVDTVAAESRGRALRVEELKKVHAAQLEEKAASEAALVKLERQMTLLKAGAEDQEKALAAERERIEQLVAQVEAAKSDSRVKSERVEELKRESAALKDDLLALRIDRDQGKKREQNVRDGLLRAEAQLSLMKDLVGLQARAKEPEVEEPVQRRRARPETQSTVKR